jgi:hypothetical protein
VTTTRAAYRPAIQRSVRIVRPPMAKPAIAIINKEITATLDHLASLLATPGHHKTTSTSLAAAALSSVIGGPRYGFTRVEMSVE